MSSAARGPQPHNLPTHLTSFVGRAQEVSDTRCLLASARLLTLTGAGGVGKTRLALQVAAEVLGNYSGGAWFIDLAPLHDGAFVPTAVAEVLAVNEEPPRPLVATLADVLGARSVLLVLDNCEHLVAACAELVDCLLCEGTVATESIGQPIQVDEHGAECFHPSRDKDRARVVRQDCAAPGVR